MSKKKNIWKITAKEKISHTVWFDVPVDAETATWQYESQDDNIVEVGDTEYLDTLEVVKVE